jgi:hypothetical protein
MTPRCRSQATKRTNQAHSLQQELKKGLRCFGRQCRGPGHVFVNLVRQTEQALLELGEPITALGPQAQQLLDQATALSDSTRERFAEVFNAAMRRHAHIRQQSKGLTPGKKLRHCKLVKPSDLTIAPLLKGKSNCPAQFGRKPGIVSDPATGFLFANQVPAGNPRDSSDVLPLLATVQRAIERAKTAPRLRVHSVAGDLGIKDKTLRQARHERGLLTVGIPKTIAPIQANPSPEEVRDLLNEAGLNRQRPPHQVRLACAGGYRRPVVESHIASLLSRGAGHVRYKGHPGAVLQLGMTAMAHNGAVVVRIRQQRLSKRAHKFRRWLGLRHRKINEINSLKN